MSVSVVLCIAFFFSLPCVAEEEKAQDMQMIRIEGGRFTMGTRIKSKRDTKYHEDEAPLEVSVAPFRIGKYPVTVSQFCEFLNSVDTAQIGVTNLYRAKLSGIVVKGGRYRPAAGLYRAPMASATWKGTAAFCKWLSEKTDRNFRLPSEAEWEFAARGVDGREYPWGNRVEPIESRGDRWLPYGEPSRVADKTSPVGSYPGNATHDGVMDMCAYSFGEWCANKYLKTPTAKDATRTTMDTEDLVSSRVVRGGSTKAASRQFLFFPFLDRPRHWGCAWTRLSAAPHLYPKSSTRYGFRVAEDAEAAVILGSDEDGVKSRFSPTEDGNE